MKFFSPWQVEWHFLLAQVESSYELFKVPAQIIRPWNAMQTKMKCLPAPPNHRPHAWPPAPTWPLSGWTASSTLLRSELACTDAAGTASVKGRRTSGMSSRRTSPRAKPVQGRWGRSPRGGGPTGWARGADLVEQSLYGDDQSRPRRPGEASARGVVEAIPTGGGHRCLAVRTNDGRGITGWSGWSRSFWEVVVNDQNWGK